MQSILLVRTSAIGDVVQTFPVIEYLRAKFPQAKIDWVAEKGIAPLLRQLASEGKPLIDQVIEIDPKQWFKSIWTQEARGQLKTCVETLQAGRYDLVFDLQGNTKSAFVTMIAKAKEKVGFGWGSVREKTNLIATTQRFDFPLDLNIREKYLKLVQAYYGDDQPFVSRGVAFNLLPSEAARLEHLLQDPLMHQPLKLMVAVGSKWKNKKMSDETLAALLKKAQQETGAALLIIYGNAEEKAEAESLLSRLEGPAAAIGELTLPLWQTLMRHVDGIIAVDSAALHFAGTTATPSFSLFGPTSAAIFKPVGQQHHTYQGSCPYGRTFHKQCPILRTCSTGACIKGLSSNELEKPFKAWLEELIPKD